MFHGAWSRGDTTRMWCFVTLTKKEFVSVTYASQIFLSTRLTPDSSPVEISF